MVDTGPGEAPEPSLWLPACKVSTGLPARSEWPGGSMCRTARPCWLLDAARPRRHLRSSDACTTTLTRPWRRSGLGTVIDVDRGFIESQGRAWVLVKTGFGLGEELA